MKLSFVAGLALAATATAQVPEPELPPGTTTASALHRAWLQEVLDLDTAGAIAGYTEVAADNRPSHFARWIAVARLFELRRLQVTKQGKLDLTDAPIPLRAEFAAHDQPVDLAGLMAHVKSDPAKVFDELANEQLQLPTLRPLVVSAESWAVDQIGPSRIDRLRRLVAETDTRPPLTSRVFAARVLSAELRGRTSQADELRSLYFTPWQPPPAATDPAVDVARIRHHIGQLLLEREWTGGWRALHLRLSSRFDELAAEDPAAAVALVRRVPHYAERLLMPLPNEQR